MYIQAEDTLVQQTAKIEEQVNEFQDKHLFIHPKLFFPIKTHYTHYIIIGQMVHVCEVPQHERQGSKGCPICFSSSQVCKWTNTKVQKLFQRHILLIFKQRH